MWIKDYKDHFSLKNMNESSLKEQRKERFFSTMQISHHLWARVSERRVAFCVAKPVAYVKYCIQQKCIHYNNHTDAGIPARTQPYHCPTKSDLANVKDQHVIRFSDLLSILIILFNLNSILKPGNLSGRFDVSNL